MKLFVSVFLQSLVLYTTPTHASLNNLPWAASQLEVYDVFGPDSIDGEAWKNSNIITMDTLTCEDHLNWYAEQYFFKLEDGDCPVIQILNYVEIW